MISNEKTNKYNLNDDQTDKIVQYKEQDIIMDPNYDKGENINDYFVNKKKTDDLFAKSIKNAKKKKIFDQDYDLEKCDILDVDKKSYDKILDLIFEINKDKKYSVYLDKIIKEDLLNESFEDYVEKNSVEKINNNSDQSEEDHFGKFIPLLEHEKKESKIN